MSAAGPDALLRLEAVGKRFGGVRALSDISMSVGKNRIVGVIGPNGAGKTTLFNLITGAYRSDSGTIVFDGRKITDWPRTASFVPGSRAPSRASACLPE